MLKSFTEPILFQRGYANGYLPTKIFRSHQLYLSLHQIEVDILPSIINSLSYGSLNENLCFKALCSREYT